MKRLFEFLAGAIAGAAIAVLSTPLIMTTFEPGIPWLVIMATVFLLIFAQIFSWENGIGSLLGFIIGSLVTIMKGAVIASLIVFKFLMVPIVIFMLICLIYRCAKNKFVS